MSPSKPQRVAVIGGGVSGLAAAHRLTTLEPSVEVALFEASSRVGGILQTDRVEGYLIERSADNFVTNFPWGVELCRELGIDGELLETDAARRKALIVRNGKLHPVPAGFQLLTPSQVWPLVTSPLLSLGGKVRVLREYFVPRRTETGDESLASFATRRLGREAYERLVQPLVGGIYTADPTQLSMQAALPRFVELEQKYGSLIRAARKVGGGEQAAAKQASGARYSLFVAPRDGMQTIVDAVAARLPRGCVRLNSPVSRLERTANGWQIQHGDGHAESFDAVIVALPAPQASRLVATFDDGLAAELGRIPYAGASVAISGYELRQIESSPRASPVASSQAGRPRAAC
jgi:oxygen-dependent protoporphyrinogen oxidase